MLVFTDEAMLHGWTIARDPPRKSPLRPSPALLSRTRAGSRARKTAIYLVSRTAAAVLISEAY
jgi:hypothetical protein